MISKILLELLINDRVFCKESIFILLFVSCVMGISICLDKESVFNKSLRL